MLKMLVKGHNGKKNAGKMLVGGVRPSTSICESEANFEDESHGALKQQVIGLVAIVSVPD